jgi:thiol-disulfide isomerase/thioredoxin
VKEQSGKIVVVDIWSTSCVPCLREFPHLVDMQARYPDDVVCVGLNCDYIGLKKRPPEFYTERVTKTLVGLKADKVTNLLCTLPADDLFAAVKLDSIPAVFVYDRQGTLAHRFDNRTSAAADVEGVSYEKQVTPAVDALVERK